MPRSERALAPGSPVPVPRERLLELLELVVGKQLGGTGSSNLPDLTVKKVGQRIGRSPSTVRQMCADGELDMPIQGQGAYKHRRKEWLIPEAALAAYQERERSGGGSRGGNISDWKRANSTPKRRRKDAA